MFKRLLCAMQGHIPRMPFDPPNVHRLGYSCDCGAVYLTRKQSDERVAALTA